MVRRVLAILEENKLYLKPEKCEFEKQQVEYLGLIVSQGKIEMDPVKVEGVSKWPTPGNVTERTQWLSLLLNSVIGTANTVQGNTTIVESQIVQATTKVSKPKSIQENRKTPRSSFTNAILSQLDATQFYFCIELGKREIEQCVE